MSEETKTEPTLPPPPSEQPLKQLRGGYVTEGGEEESQFLNVSVRGIITLVIVLTVCGMSVGGMNVEEPLYTLVGMVVGWYFGQQQKKKNEIEP